jgi:hypothetical protein
MLVSLVVMGLAHLEEKAGLEVVHATTTLTSVSDCDELLTSESEMAELA